MIEKYSLMQGIELTQEEIEVVQNNLKETVSKIGRFRVIERKTDESGRYFTVQIIISIKNMYIEANENVEILSFRMGLLETSIIRLKIN